MAAPKAKKAKSKTPDPFRLRKAEKTDPKARTCASEGSIAARDSGRRNRRFHSTLDQQHDSAMEIS